MTAVEPGPVKQQAGPPEWFKPGKSSRSRSHIRSRSSVAIRSRSRDYSSDSVSDSDSSSDDTRSGKVSYREWMAAGSRVKKDETGHRLIWGYENIHEQLAEETPLVLKEKELRRREEAERQKRRKERKEQRRAEKEERRKKRKKEKEDKAMKEEEEANEEKKEEHTSSKKYDLKEAAKQSREAQKAAGHATSTVQGKSILLNVLQSTLHENRVRDGDLIDRARAVFKQAGYDEGGKRDVKLLSAHLNSGMRPPSPRRPSNKDDVAEVVPIVSYEEFKHKKHEAKTEDRKAKIKAKMKEQKAKVQAFIAAQEKEKALKAAEQEGTKTDSRQDNEISASVDLLLASVSASLETKKTGNENVRSSASKDLNAALWATNSALPSAFVPPPPDFPPPGLPPFPPFPHLPS